MPVIKIRTAGTKQAEKPAAKPAAKKAAARRKPAAKRAAPAKKTSTAKKPAARKQTPAKKSTTRAKNATPVRRDSKGIDPVTEARILKSVEKAGKRRAAAEIEHKESVNALHQAAKEAIEQGVSMAKVADASGISRQWLYKMGEFAERGGAVRAGTSNGTAAAKTVAKPAAKQTTRRSRTAKPSAPRTRTRIRSRA